MRRKKKTNRRKAARHTARGASAALSTQLGIAKSIIQKNSDDLRKVLERLEDAEIQVNLLTRLVTTLCVEKLGMRVGVLKRLLKRIEKEAIRDSQILHLESLYNLPHDDAKKSSQTPKAQKKDPWDEIS